MMVFISTCSITAIIVCTSIFEHIQWRSALNDFIADGYFRLRHRARRRPAGRGQLALHRGDRRRLEQRREPGEDSGLRLPPRARRQAAREPEGALQRFGF